ncbi:uncharacterized protein LOC108471601 [Gossypium arboreum]|uniref:uncharacterized protein LOC108471601 n=1 Tax=Gossypium arboreum TaxID=29729 RepID=UPI000818FA48|nr:uncharacterized protein LOC108471601 [Gossypium arboreum]
MARSLGKKRKRKGRMMLPKRSFHLALAARSLLNWKNTTAVESSQAAEDVQVQEEQVFTASCFASSSKVRKNWLIDSGCTHQMASEKGMFRELDTSFVPKVRIGNGEFIEAKGKGKVMISTQSGKKTILEFLFVPDIDQNLLSVGQLLEKGYSFVFERKTCVFKDIFDQVLVTVAMHDISFILDVNQLEAKAHTAPADESCLWHKRLGYFALFIDDCTRFCWVSFLKQKLDVANFSCKFKSLAENQANCKLKTLRSDNGIEYVSQRCLLFKAKMPNNFWAKALTTSVYLLNRLPTNVVKGKTPFEAWFSQKPNVSHLKMFGCLCYTLVPTEKRTKLEKRSMPRVFVGYNSVKKRYRVFDPSTKKIVHAEIEAETEDDYDDAPVRGTRTLMDIYERCDMTIVEPSCFDEATKEGCWKEAMEAELRMIQKNDTWELASSQQYGIDFFETFGPVARLDTIRLLFALAAQKQQKVYQLDVKSAFLNGFLKEEIFVEQPDGFKVLGEEHKVYKLKKALYGLK